VVCDEAAALPVLLGCGWGLCVNRYTVDAHICLDTPYVRRRDQSGAANARGAALQRRLSSEALVAWAAHAAAAKRRRRLLRVATARHDRRLALEAFTAWNNRCRGQRRLRTLLQLQVARRSTAVQAAAFAGVPLEKHPTQHSQSGSKHCTEYMALAEMLSAVQVLRSVRSCGLEASSARECSVNQLL